MEGGIFVIMFLNLCNQEILFQKMETWNRIVYT